MLRRVRRLKEEATLKRFYNHGNGYIELRPENTSMESMHYAAGYEPSHAGAENPHRRNVYFIDPHGFEVEFVEYGSDVPAERNNDLH